MDKSAIKTYAVEARRKLIEAVRQKAYQLHIFEDGALSPDEAYQRLRADGIFLTPEQNSARLRLCNELAALGHDLDNKAAYQHLIENVACTWFNRLIALRIMEVNDWLPSNIRILSSREPGRIEPDAVREVERLDYLNQTKVAELRADTDVNAAEKLYKYILISQCNALSAILPGMFQRENDYTELLLPDALLAKGGIVNDLVSKINEDNFNVEKQGQIEIIGWLYQFYISEKKDEVFAGLKKNIKINKDTIPAATQLFTPEWIVKYMVENSLGRLWLDSHPNADLRAEWKYYVDEAEQEPEVAEQLRILRSQSPVKRPEDIKLIDPCMGSGHILVYAFDVLFQIYQSEGYSEREIPNLILQNNIYGLDIDDRAGQLAYFALMIKARSYNRRFFRQEQVPQPHVYAIRDSESIRGAYEYEMGNFLLSEKHQDTLNYLLTAFRDAKEFGSILKLEERDYQGLAEAWKYTASQTTENFNLTLWYAAVEKEIPPLIEQAIMLTQKYDVVVTNPPYRGARDIGGKLPEYLSENYANGKNDLYTAFVEKCSSMTSSMGYQAMITQQSWMFLSTYEKLREDTLANDIVTMTHLGAHAFEEIGGEVVQTTAFVLRKSDMRDYRGTFYRLVDYQSQNEKKNAFLDKCNCYHSPKKNYCKIPGIPVAYWANEAMLRCFAESPPLTSVASPKAGMTTGDNNRFLRFWHEVSFSKMGLACINAEMAEQTHKKWFPYNKGGGFRKWYGLNEHVVLWENNGYEIKNAMEHGRKIASVRSERLYFKEGITWSALASALSCRKTDVGFLFDDKGSTAFTDSNMLIYLLGFLNTKLVNSILSIFNPTLSFQSGNLGALPLILSQNNKPIVDSLVSENISLSRTDWDSFEISWDFKMHPLIQYKIMAGFEDCGVGRYSGTIEQAFKWWKQNSERQFSKLKANEEELNRIFIDIYGLQDELTPEVEDKDVTVRKADLGRDIRSFLSYAVGCMFGRYSLDEPGLVFAGGKFDIAKYKTFVPEDDNILPIGSADYFDDDIVVRFIEFVRVVYGDNTLGENLSFIADALYPNGNGSPQERIRRYFLNDFYKDHVKIYQKRPIYWLLDSGKKDGFKALVYLHRYDKYTVARARTDYLHPLQRKYDAEIKRLEMLSGSTEDAREKAAYRKEIDALIAKIDECRVYDQVVSHIAHQQIELDLDDGVKVNYEKFQGVDVPKDNGKSEKMDLLGRI